MSNDDTFGDPKCPICGREYNGQEVEVVKQEEMIATLKTKCDACGHTYTFKAEAGE